MKKLMTIFGAIIFASFIFTSCGSSCNDFAGAYSGTSEMGLTKGLAKITIELDCSATLAYKQGDMANTVEKGEIIKEGANYKFKSTSGGGTYDLKISKNQIILDGSNWHCVLTK
jgi:hypothetical protein